MRSELVNVFSQPFSLDVATYRLILRSVAQRSVSKDGNTHSPAKCMNPAALRHVLPSFTSPPFETLHCATLLRVRWVC
jgi:hypothetical protein